MASRVGVASKSPISKISSRARSPVRADSKAVNKADSRADNNYSPTLHVHPQRKCWGSLYCTRSSDGWEQMSSHDRTSGLDEILGFACRLTAGGPVYLPHGTVLFIATPL